MGLVSAMVFLCAGTAVASEWNFYGSARVSTFWEDSDLDDEVNLKEYLQVNARIGANVKASDKITGRFEYGTGNGNANIRLFYGTWDFGAGTLRVGQDYTPNFLPLSNQVWNHDNGLHGFGEPYPGRHAQIKLKVGAFQIAAVSVDTNYYDAAANDIADDDTQVVIPKIEASYAVNAGNATIDIGAGFATFEYNDSEDIDSYFIQVKGVMKAAGVNLGMVVFYGQNAGNIVDCTTTGDDSGQGYARINAAGQVDDVENYGGEIVAGYTFNDMLAVEAGVGYMQGEYDNDTEEDAVFAYYLQVPLTLAPGVTITPEAGVIDYDEDGQEQLTYFGAKWQINF